MQKLQFLRAKKHENIFLFDIFKLYNRLLYFMTYIS